MAKGRIWRRSGALDGRWTGCSGLATVLIAAAAWIGAGCEESPPACAGDGCLSGGGGSGGSAPEPDCAPPARDCSGDVPRVCDEQGTWQPQQACAAQGKACVEGECLVPSCHGFGPACGPLGDEDCCTSLEVPAGTFFRMTTLSQPPSPSDPASVSAFRLDRFEVSVGRFRRFVEAYPASKPAAGAGAHPLIAGSGWDASWDPELPADAAGWDEALGCLADRSTWTPASGPREGAPVNCLDWYAAFAFCAWDGGRLPTEAEWLYAAVGGDEQRYYPWTTSLSDIDASRVVYACLGDGEEGCALSDIPTVGSRSPAGDGKWGQADMAGSLSEWALDWYSPAYVDPCSDCADLDPANMRIRRGGSWSVGEQMQISFVRNADPPGVRFAAVGVRCARVLDPGAK